MVGDGLEREGWNLYQHLSDTGKECCLNEVFGCLLCHAVCDLC